MHTPGQFMRFLYASRFNHTGGGDRNGKLSVTSVISERILLCTPKAFTGGIWGLIRLN